MKVDDKDKRILNALLRNSKLSLREIAKIADVSVATVMNRVNRLEKEGIIKKYSTILDYEKLGFDVEVLIEIRISKDIRTSTRTVCSFFVTCRNLQSGKN